MELKGLYLCQIAVFGITLLFQNCAGFCFRANLMAEMTMSRRLRYYCEYKPLHGSSIRLFPGSNMYLVDQCLQCICTMDGLQCCGFGHNGGAIAFKKDCKMLLDGCQPFIVRKDNHTLDCFTGKPINMTALSEQLPHPDNVYIFETFKLPEPTLAESVTPGVEQSPMTTTLPPKEFASTMPLATPTTDGKFSPSSTSVPTPLTNQETTTVAPATEIVSTTASPAKVSTTEAPATITTAAAEQQSSPQNEIQTPTFADYLQFLMFSRNTAPNFSGQTYFPPYFNTGNNMREMPFPPSLNAGNNMRDTSFPSALNVGNNMRDTSFPPTMNTVNNVRATSFPNSQPPQQQSNNLWQQDYFLPWFWFM